MNPKKRTAKPKIKVFNKRKKSGNQKNVAELREKYSEIDTSTVNSFADLPLSQETLKGLKACNFTSPTDIQKQTIKLSLTGQDILGAAQTGSGKTLAFLIPILEKLYCEKWTKLDGLGALVITPTRELAYQIFEQLRQIGRFHDFSAGLVIGGKDLKHERKLMDRCNIIICTPGRLLQHMDENPLVDCVNLQILVLDEADRCLDMGFQQTMDAIITNLPAERQTLLFSATQTKSVRDLSRLSLKDPAYVSVHEHLKHSTPQNLQQSYVVCELKDKMSIVYNFIRMHRQKKIIVFFNTSKQVKFMYEIILRLRLKTRFWPLYGTLHQLRRMKIYDEFSKSPSGVLFATDLAGRGLDFPEVHWVVQADCPEDVDTYIHRAGRTARYLRGGESLLLLLPSEVKMVELLEARKIPIEKIEINPDKLRDPVKQMHTYLTHDDLQDTAQRAFVHYIKSIYLMKNKEVFNVKALDTNSFAASLGLNMPPRLPFLEKLIGRNNNANVIKIKADEPPPNKRIKFDNSDDEEEEEKEQERQEEPIKSDVENSTKEEQNKKEEEEGDEEEENEGEDNWPQNEIPEDSLAAKIDFSKCSGSLYDDNEEYFGRSDNVPSNLEDLVMKSTALEEPSTQSDMVKKALKEHATFNRKIKFDDDTETSELLPITETILISKPQNIATIAQNSQIHKDLDPNDDPVEDFGRDFMKNLYMNADQEDVLPHREKVKSKHKEEKRKLKDKKRQSKLKHDETEDDDDKDQVNKEAEEIDEDFDDSSDDESEEDPDLSWLPDPDRVYGKKSPEEIESLLSQDSVKNGLGKSQKKSVNKKDGKSKSKRKNERLEEFDDDEEEDQSPVRTNKPIPRKLADMGVKDAEELAMMLLKNR